MRSATSTTLASPLPSTPTCPQHANGMRELLQRSPPHGASAKPGGRMEAVPAGGGECAWERPNQCLSWCHEHRTWCKGRKSWEMRVKAGVASRPGVEHKSVRPLVDVSCISLQIAI